MKNKRYLYLILLSVLLLIVAIVPWFLLHITSEIVFRIVATLLFLLLIFIIRFYLPRKIYFLFSLVLLLAAYIFCGYCEIGSFKVTGHSFGNEFWQFFNWDTISLAATTSILSFSLGLVCLVIILLLVFYMFLQMPDFWSWRCPQCKIRSSFFAVVLAGMCIFVNLKYSSLAAMFNSYKIYREMLADAEQSEYLRKIPARDEIKAVAGKNILRIIIESAGDVYTDENRFHRLVPNLVKYKKTGIVAANMLQTPSQANSYMGHVVSNCGRYFHIPLKDEKYDVCLGDVLKKAGYTNVFMRGAEKNSAGPFTELYSEERGYDEFIDRKQLEEKYDTSYIGSFGFFDEILFKAALEKYKELLATKKPFSLTVFTLDTHGFPQDFSKSCKTAESIYSGPFAQDKMVQAMHCTDSLLGKFLEDVSKLPDYDNLVIVLHGDHVQHISTPAISSAPQMIYTTIFGSNISPFNQLQQTFLMDLPPTILSVAGIVTNAKFYVGDDFSKSFVREKTTTNEYSDNLYSNKSSVKCFRRSTVAAKDQFAEDSFLHYEDSLVNLDWVELEGSIFKTYYLYMNYVNNKNSFLVALPIDKTESNDSFIFNKGVIFEKIEDGYALALTLGVATDLKSILFADLVNGDGWNLDGNTVNYVKVPKLDFSTKEKVFEITDFGNPDIKLDQMRYLGSNKFLSLGGDPKMFFNLPVRNSDKCYIVEAELSSPVKSEVKLYYRYQGGGFSEYTSATAYTKLGENKLVFFIPKGSFDNAIRFDVGEDSGEYQINRISFFEL